LLDYFTNYGTDIVNSKQEAFLIDIGAIAFVIPDCKHLTTPLGYCLKQDEV